MKIVHIIILVLICDARKIQEYNPDLHKNLHLKDVTILTPPSCRRDTPIDMLYMVHTAPDHFEQRMALRNSWTSNHTGFNKSRTIFFIGKSNSSLEENVMHEYSQFEDIFLYNLIDTYRNMSIKVGISLMYISTIQRRHHHGINFLHLY